MTLFNAQNFNEKSTNLPLDAENAAHSMKSDCLSTELIRSLRLNFCSHDMVLESGELNTKYFEEQIKKPIKWSTAANQKLLDAFAEYGKNQFDRIQKEKFPIISTTDLRIQTMKLLCLSTLNDLKQ